MEVKAYLRHLRMAPRKVRLIVDVVRGMSADEAETRLQFIKKDASRPVLKLLQSAIANAEHNFKLDRTKLYVKTITADAGVTLKRFTARAMGRGAPIRKRATHITIVLSDDPKPVKKLSGRAARAVATAQLKTRATKKPKSTEPKTVPAEAVAATNA